MQIEHNALLIAGWAVQPVLYSARLTEEQRAHAGPLHDLLRRKSLLGLGAFNEAAWLGEGGILATWNASEWRRHIGVCGPLKVTVWGIAGKLGCVVERSHEKVVLSGLDRPGSPLGYSDSNTWPRVAAEIIWQAADIGRELAAAMQPCEALS